MGAKEGKKDGDVTSWQVRREGQIKYIHLTQGAGGDSLATKE